MSHAASVIPNINSKSNLKMKKNTTKVTITAQPESDILTWQQWKAEVGVGLCVHDGVCLRCN